MNPLVNVLTWSSPFESTYLTVHACFICEAKIKLNSKICILAQIFHPTDDKKIAIIAHHSCVVAHDSAKVRAICLQRAGVDTGHVQSQWYDELQRKYDMLSKEIASMEELTLSSKPAKRFRSVTELESYCSIKNEMAKPVSEDELRARVKYMEEHPMEELEVDEDQLDEDGNR
jgi:hypothetical protein